MSFDGDTQLERQECKTLADVWDHSSKIGSKWYFYPFHFAVTDTGKTIKDAPHPLQYLNGRRVATVSREFARAAKLPEAQSMDCDDFAFLVAGYA